MRIKQVKIILSAAVLLAASPWIILYNFFWVLESNDGYYDLGSFIASNQLMKIGKDPYSVDSPYVFEVRFSEAGLTGIAPNLNPPIFILLMAAFPNRPTPALLQTWRIVSLFTYLIALILLRLAKGKGRQTGGLVLFSVGLAGFWHTVQLGQVYIFLLLVTAGIITLLEGKRQIAAGILMGLLVAIKPNFIYWAAILGIYGYRKTCYVSGVTSICLSGLPALIFGPDLYPQWLHATFKYTPHLLAFPGNNSLQGLTARFQHPEAGFFVSAILGVVVLFLVWRYKPEESEANLLAITTTLLISPIAWTGYTILLLPYFWFIKKWRAEHWISGLILCMPFPVILENFEKNNPAFIFWGWFYGWGLIILLAATCARIVSRPSPRPGENKRTALLSKTSHKI